MKTSLTRIAIGAALALSLAACATSGQPVDVSTSKLAVATHADLTAAAAYADAHGFPARAAKWRALDTLLAAQETQISACANAIAAALPKVPTGAPPTPFLAVEMGAEALGNVAGPSPQVTLNCAAIPLPILPALPKL